MSDIEVPKDPSFSNEYTPEKAYTKADIATLQDVDPGNFIRDGNLDLHGWAEEVKKKLVQNLLGGFFNVVEAVIDWINKMIAALLDGLDGITGGIFDLDVLADRFRGTEQRADKSLIDVTTTLSGASGAGDIATFPRMLMVPDSDGNHPAYAPGKSVVDVYFLRADRGGDFTRFKVVMGGDTALFDIDAAYLGLYRANPVTNTLILEWSSPNLKSVLGNTRREYSVGMGKIVTVAQGEVLALAQLQIAPGMAQTPRRVSCLRKSPMGTTPGAFPPITGGYLTNRSSMPESIAMSSLTEDDNKIGWFALAP